MASDTPEIKARINGKIYCQIEDAHKIAFVTGALDMLGHGYRSAAPEHKARIGTIIQYANRFESEALKEQFDTYLDADSERQKHAAAAALFTALNASCRFDSVGKRWRWRPTVIAVSCIALLVYSFFFAVLVARSILAFGLGNIAAGFFAIVAVVAGFWLLKEGAALLFTGKRLPPWLARLLFREAGARNAPSVEPKIRIEGAKYRDMPEQSRKTYFIGALDMFSFMFFYFEPEHKALAEAVSAHAGRVASDPLAQRFDDYMLAAGAGADRGAAQCVADALEEWTWSDKEAPPADGLAASAPIV